MAAGKKAFVPFVTAGDPSLEFTSDILHAFAESGCSIAEVGIPYSDPIADGPTIQSSYARVLDRGTTFQNIADTIAAVSPTVQMPIVMMVSFSIVFRRGVEEFVALAKKSGVSGLIVPDLPFDEAAMLSKVCKSQDVSLIQLVTPTTGRERAIQIAETTSGFLYYVSVTGITGERIELPPEIADNVAWLKDRIELPICIGFGISQPEQAKMMADIGDGIIIGSAIVRKTVLPDGQPSPTAKKDVMEFVNAINDAISK